MKFMTKKLAKLLKSRNNLAIAKELRRVEAAIEYVEGNSGNPRKLKMLSAQYIRLQAAGRNVASKRTRHRRKASTNSWDYKYGE